MLLGDDRMRVGQLLEIADQLLERAAFDDDLLMLRATGAAGEVAALISREL
ncbi:hypothetical protein I0Q12_19960, partial [Rhodococcus sp. CX]|nr:hypothetical protein [Rhodococcus sp. CX]